MSKGTFFFSVNMDKKKLKCFSMFDLKNISGDDKKNNDEIIMMVVRFW